MSGVACCSGSVDEGVPTGVEGKISLTTTSSSVDCYFSGSDASFSTPSPTGTTVILATDVFGWKLPNARLLCDKITKEQGHRCIVPDLFNGGAPPPDLAQDMWKLIDANEGATFFQKAYAVSRLIYFMVPFIVMNKHDTGVQLIKKIIAEIRTKDPSCKHIVVNGYCWGATIAIKLSQDNSIAGLTAVYAAHAGNLKIPGDYELIKIPACIVIAEKDFEVKEKEQKIIKETMAKSTILNQVFVVSDVSHGFAMRGSRKDPIVNEKRNEAEKMLFDFIKLTCV